ncbi:MAG: TonB-dependent receptor [Caulobacterales bacterium]|nr:TonB-dependent receptor [Caulobacterales bacterium]
MRGRSSGVIGYARPRAALGWGVAALAGAAVLAGGARAADEAVDGGAEVDPVTVHGRRTALDRPTELPGLPATVQDTPQAVNVIDAAQLKAQGVSSLEQALRNVPGITVAIGEGGTLNGDQFKIRGFDSKDDVYVDGLRDFGVYTRDSFNYEEVQVLKGPSGALFGRGTTGGAINTLSKRPKLEDFASADVYAGNGRYYRALADVDRRLGETTAARVALMASSTGVADRDMIYSHRWGAAAAVATGLGTDTQASLSYLHQHDRRRPDYGIIIVQRPGDLIALPASEYGVGVERSSFLGFRDDRDVTDADIVTLRVSHRASEHLTFTSDTRYGRYRRYFQYTTLDQCTAACTAALFDGDPATEAFGGIGGSSPYGMRASGLQNITTARIDGAIGGLRNQAVLGFDLSRQVNDKAFLAYTLPPGVTTRPAVPHPIVSPNPDFPAGYGVFTPVPGVNLFCPATGNCTTTVTGTTSNVAGTGTLSSRGVATDLGAFLTDRLWLTPSLSLIGFMRLDRYRASLDAVLYTGAAAPSVTARSTLKSPRLSAVFEPRGDQTFYLSWGRSETPQGTSVVGAGTALTVAAKDLEPEVSRIVEAGAKVGVPQTALTATASVFRIDKSNALQVDPATGFLQAQSGERQRATGVELGLTGRITPRWSLSAGYAYVDAKIRSSFSNCTVPTATTGTPSGIVCPVGVTTAIPIANPVAIGRQVTSAPRHSGSLYSTYELTDHLTVGGDLVYQGRMAVQYQARSLSYADRATLVPLRIAQVPKSVTLDAFIAYRTGPYRVSLNLYNLTDRLNYAQVFANRAVPAAGRTAIVSLGASF